MDITDSARTSDNAGLEAAGKTDPAEVLLVDDNVTSLAILSSILKAAGHPCVTADSAIAALDLAENNNAIKVVLTDIYMPGMDGFEFVRALKHSSACGAPLQILMLTGSPDLDAAVDALRLGVSDFLTKPVPPSKIIEAVRRAKQRADDATKALAPVPASQMAEVARDAQNLAARLWALTQPPACQASSPSGSARPIPPERSVLGVTITLKQLMQELAGKTIDERDWSLLLAVARSVEEGRELSVSGLMIAINNTSSTTILRRINRLWHSGYLAKKTDPNDRRRDFVTLTPKGQEVVARFLDAASKQTGLAYIPQPAAGLL